MRIYTVLADLNYVKAGYFATYTYTNSLEHTRLRPNPERQTINPAPPIHTPIKTLNE